MFGFKTSTPLPCETPPGVPYTCTKTSEEVVDVDCTLTNLSKIISYLFSCFLSLITWSPWPGHTFEKQVFEREVRTLIVVSQINIDSKEFLALHIRYGFTQLQLQALADQKVQAIVDSLWDRVKNFSSKTCSIKMTHQINPTHALNIEVTSKESWLCWDYDRIAFIDLS